MPSVSTTLTNPYTSDLADAQKKQRLADMLRAQSLEPTQQTTASGYVVPYSFTQGLAKLLQGYGAKKLEGEAIDSQKAASGKYQQQLAALLGTGGSTTPQTSAPGSPNTLADASVLMNDPKLLELAKFRAEQSKPIALREGDLVRPGADGNYQSVFSQPKLSPDMQPIRNPQGQVTGAQAIPGAAEGTEQLAAAKGRGQAQSELITVDTPQGPRLMTKAQAANQAAPSGAGIALQDPAVQHASNTASAKGVDDIFTNYGTLRTAPDTIANLENVKKLAADPKLYAGSGAETKLAVAKFFNNNLGTHIAEDKVKNTEVLRSELFRQVVDNLKKMDSQPSESQQKMLQQSMGSIGTDPNAIPRVVQITQDIIAQRVGIHNKNVDQAMANGTKFPFTPHINLPKHSDVNNDKASPPGTKSGDAGNRLTRNPDGSFNYRPR